MTGLDKIIAEITGEANAEAEKTIANAKAQAAQILADAKAEVDAKCDRIAATAQADVADIGRSQESAEALQRRQRTLATKQEALAETLEKALAQVLALPDGQYFDLLVKLAAAAAQPGEGKMLLNEKDKKRLPADFMKKVAAALPAGATLSLSDATRPIDGGFVLKYGDIEENCSFAAMFNARADEFSDLVRETLFV